MALPNSQTSIQAAPWSRLRAWIDDKEAWERQNNQPAPLTTKELAAISTLVPLNEEPSVGDQDYISRLMHYVQSRHLNHPDYREEPVSVIVNGAPQQGWRCFIAVAGQMGEFPREGYGLGQDGLAPVFQSKKKARQFASQNALDYLQKPDTSPASSLSPAVKLESKANPYVKQESPRDSPFSPTTIANATPNKKPKLRKSSESPSLFVSPPSHPRSVLSPPQQRVRRQRSSSVLGGGSSDTPTTPAREPSTLECVTMLAMEMGIDNPTYVLEPEDDLPDFWRCRAVFRSGSKVPDGLGLSRNMLSKVDARNEAAHQVLMWLKEERQRRQADLDYLRNGKA